MWRRLESLDTVQSNSFGCCQIVVSGARQLGFKGSDQVECYGCNGLGWTGGIGQVSGGGEKLECCSCESPVMDLHVVIAMHLDLGMIMN